MIARPSLFAAFLLTTIFAFEPANARTSGGNMNSEGGMADSGVSLYDEAREWVGQAVVSSDGVELGTLKSVAQTGGGASAAGILVVEAESGEEIELPISGATSDGETVTASAPAERAQ